MRSSLRAFLLTLSALLFVGMATIVKAVCIPTAYSVTSSAPPPSANWTDTSGAVWTPAGGFPGCAPGDTASNTNASPTTLIINSSIPNPIMGLNMNCAGCVVTLQPGGQLSLAGAGSIGSGTTLQVAGGGLTVQSGGALTFLSGSSFTSSGGTINVDPGGAMTLSGSSTLNGTMQVGGTLAIPATASLDVAAPSQLLLDNATVTGGGTITNQGIVSGTGNLTANLTNDATVRPGGSSLTGVLSMTGAYTQGATGLLEIELAGASSGQFDQLAVNGLAMLDGTLNASLLSFTPAGGTTWPVLTFASRSGDFSTKNLPSYPGGFVTSSYTPTELDLIAVTPTANLTVSKTMPSSAVAGQNVVATVTVTNNGPSAAASVVVSDPTPAGFTFVSNSGACTSAYPCSLGTLNSGQSATITSTYSTSPNLNQSVTNTATASSSTLDPDTGNNAGTGTTSVTPQADLSIAKSGAPNAIAGQNVVYTVTVKNNGASSAGSAIVSDPTPANLTFVSNSGDCTSAYPCSLGTMSAGQSATITSTYAVADSFTGNVTNTATVSSTTSDPNTGDNSSSAITNVAAEADLSIAKSGLASVTAGQNVTYSVTVTNAGPSSAANVVVGDPTPANLTFVSNSGACASAYPCSLGTLAPGQSATIASTYSTSPSFAGSVTNTANVASSTSDPNAANDSANATTVVTALTETDLTITKTGAPAATSGRPITYTITVTNAGSVPATAVVVSDPTPANLTFLSNSGACTTPYPCMLGTLAAGQSAVITSTYVTAPRFTGQISNVASVSAATGDPTPSNSSDAAVTAFAAAEVPALGLPALLLLALSLLALAWLRMR